MFLKLFHIIVFIIFTLSSISQKKVKESEYNPEFIHNLIEANRQKILGNFEAVRILYEKCLQINPTSAAVHYELAAYYVQVNQLYKSIGYARKAIKLDPKNLWYKALLGVLYKQTNQPYKSIAVYKKLIKQNPERLDFYYELAYLYLYTKKPIKAIKKFDEAEAIIGINEAIVLEKERIYSYIGKYKKAEAEIQKLVNINPNEIRYYGILAELYISQNKLNKAKVVYEKMLNLDSTNGLVNLSLSDFYRMRRDYEKSFYHLQMAFRSTEIDVDTKIKMLITLSGYAERNPSLAKEVDKLLSILLEYYPHNPKVLTLNVDIFLLQDKQKEAYETLLKIIQIDPSKYLIWEKLLMIEHSMQAWDSLLVHSHKATEYFPFQVILYYMKAIAAYELKKYEIADEALNFIHSLVVDNKDLLVEIHALHGEVLHALGRNAESDMQLEKALELDKTNRLVLNNYSYYLSLRSDSLDKAEKMSLICVELEPDNPTFLDTYAWILYKQNKLDKALIYIEKAYKLQKNNAIIIEHYGDILYKLGRIERAIELWNEAFRTGKGSPFLEQKILHKKLIE